MVPALASRVRNASKMTLVLRGAGKRSSRSTPSMKSGIATFHSELVTIAIHPRPKKRQPHSGRLLECAFASKLLRLHAGKF